MPALPPAVATALGRYWSEIYGGAAQRLSTSDLFSNIRDRAAELGLPSVGVGAAAISTLRGYASGMIRAAAALNSADPSAPLSSDHLAVAPWSRPVTQQNLTPIYQVGISHTVQQDDGSVTTVRNTITITGQLPPTVGELRDLLTSEAALLAAESPGTSESSPHGISLGVDDFSLVAV